MKARSHASPRVIRAIPIAPREPMAHKVRREPSPTVALVIGIAIGLLAGWITAPFHW